MWKIAQVLVGHKISRFQPKRRIFSPFYSEKCKYFLGMKIIFGVIGTLSETHFLRWSYTSLFVVKNPDRFLGHLTPTLMTETSDTVTSACFYFFKFHQQTYDSEPLSVTISLGCNPLSSRLTFRTPSTNQGGALSIKISYITAFCDWKSSSKDKSTRGRPWAPTVTKWKNQWRESEKTQSGRIWHIRTQQR